MTEIMKRGLSVFALLALASCGQGASSTSSSQGGKGEPISSGNSQAAMSSSSEKWAPNCYVSGDFNGMVFFDPPYQMTRDPETSIYTYKGLMLKANQGYHVCWKDEDNLSQSTPTELIKVDEAGKYDIAFVYGNLDVSHEKVGDYVSPSGKVRYYLGGGFSSWSPGNADYELLFDEKSGYYVKDRVHLPAGGLKVVDSDAWWYPQGEYTEYIIYVEGDFSVVFDPAGGHDGWHGGYFQVTELK